MKNKKIIPYKVGDWIINNDKRVAIPNQILKITKYGYNVTRGYVSFDNVNTNYHRWTIDDAIPGEILATDLVYFIFKKEITGSTYMYCSYSIVSNDFDTSSSAIVNTEFVHPATEEQEKILFSKIHEFNYEWDERELKLSKVEPIVTTNEKFNWSEHDDSCLNSCLEYLKAVPCCGDDSELVECEKWLESLKSRILNKNN